MNNGIARNSIYTNYASIIGSETSISANLPVGRSFGWWVSLFFFLKGGKFHFHAFIGALVK